MPDCLDSPVYELDEEHATALVLNAKERMDPAWRMQIAVTVVGSLCVCFREFEMSELRRVEEMRRSGLTLNARLGGQDKANWRSLAPSGRKGLSAHWFLQVSAASEWHLGRWRGAAFRNFLFYFNSSSDGFCNVRL